MPPPALQTTQCNRGLAWHPSSWAQHWAGGGHIIGMTQHLWTSDRERRGGYGGKNVVRQPVTHWHLFLLNCKKNKNEKRQAQHLQRKPSCCSEDAEWTQTGKFSELAQQQAHSNLEPCPPSDPHPLWEGPRSPKTTSCLEHLNPYYTYSNCDSPVNCSSCAQFMAVATQDS